jgi:hypothetical protein
MDPTKALKLLLDSLDTLRRQHRAGIYPTYGQIEDLFEFAANVRTGLNAGMFAVDIAPLGEELRTRAESAERALAGATAQLQAITGVLTASH